MTDKEWKKWLISTVCRSREKYSDIPDEMVSVSKENCSEKLLCVMHNYIRWIWFVP